MSGFVRSFALRGVRFCPVFFRKPDKRTRAKTGQCFTNFYKGEFKLNQTTSDLPLPPQISEAALAGARRETSTGIVVVFDHESKTGRVCDTSLGRLIWRAWSPITQEEFATIVNSMPDIADAHHVVQ